MQEHAYRRLTVSALLVLFFGGSSWAQLNDITQTPNAANAGIQKSLGEQVGAGRGDTSTPDSSMFLIKRDPFRSIARGRQIFQRKFTHGQGLGPRTGDGMGDIGMDGSLGAGLVDSCAGCHGRPHGSAGFGGNVFTRPESRDAPHLFGLGLVEMIADEMTTDLRAIEANAVADAVGSGNPVTRILNSKGTCFGTITGRPDGTSDTTGVVGVDADLRVKPFFAEGSTFSIRDFVVGAFNNEMGLESYDPDLATAAAGGVAVTPSGLVLDGALDTIGAPPAADALDDPDGDGVVDEIPTSIVDHAEFYLLNYFKPGTYRTTTQTLLGRVFFNRSGCNQCHVSTFVINNDRRVADVDTRYAPGAGHMNNMFATAVPLMVTEDDGMGFPELKLPAGDAFVVRDFFGDFKRHDLGPDFHEANFDGTTQTQFVTEPLWGVGSTPSYGHDGRSINLREVILRHGGEATFSRNRFAQYPRFVQDWTLDFLESLVLFGPPDTASNLNPASIDLSPLFVDPTDKE